MDDEQSSEPRRLLQQVWPEWQHVVSELEASCLPINEHGWRRLQELERCRSVAGLPQRLNRRTALAQVGAHSKASISTTLREALNDVELTHDGAVRLRPSVGLRIRSGAQELDSRVLQAVLGEIVITERALAGGTTFAGEPPRVLLTVENLGAFLDISVPESCLVAHVPGWNTRTVQLVFDRLPNVPVVHFGDLDPNGVRIVRHLRELRDDLRWLVPAFWRDYVETRGLRAEWPAETDTTGAPRLVQDLSQSGVWLEQEAIVLDPRLMGSLEECLDSG